MNKQIEEMAKCSDCIHYSVCSLWSTSDLEKDEAHKYCFGNFKNAADCRKTSDVAREVIDEINNGIDIKDFNCSEIAAGYLWAIADVRKLLLKLKKKYESEGVE